MQEAGNPRNVYAELGSTWRFVMRDPDQAAHLLGKLLKTFGEDRVLWGTDSIWYGSPQDQIQAFRAFQISRGVPAALRLPGADARAQAQGVRPQRGARVRPEARRAAHEAREGPRAQEQARVPERPAARPSPPTGRARGASGWRSSRLPATRPDAAAFSVRCAEELRARPVHAHEQVLLGDAEQTCTPPRWCARAARAAASPRAGRRAARRCAPACAPAARAARPLRRGAASGMAGRARRRGRRCRGCRGRLRARTRSTILWRRMATSQAARRRAAAEARAARHHRLEHVVHQVFGQRRVVQAAPRVVHEKGAVLGQVHPAERAGGGGVGGSGSGHGSRYGGFGVGG